ncbi:MAG: response regulator [bacterium]|nr:response regulator [bacterium]
MKQSILAVDDEPHMLRLLERIITEKTQYHIKTVNNSLEVPAILDEGNFDLIITDLKMPGMDGIDILKHVREHERSEEVIIMTAFGSLESAIEALQQGVFDYITKPFKKEQIIFTVDRALRWQAIRKEASRLGRIFDGEPYESARKAFDGEYVRRLGERCRQGKAAMIERSGLTEKFIADAEREE